MKKQIQSLSKKTTHLEISNWETILKRLWLLILTEIKILYWKCRKER
jgi:hypothetical protein